MKMIEKIVPSSHHSMTTNSYWNKISQYNNLVILILPLLVVAILFVFLLKKWKVYHHCTIRNLLSCLCLRPKVSSSLLTVSPLHKVMERHESKIGKTLRSSTPLRSRKTRGKKELRSSSSPSPSKQSLSAKTSSSTKEKRTSSFTTPKIMTRAQKIAAAAAASESSTPRSLSRSKTSGHHHPSVNRRRG